MTKFDLMFTIGTDVWNEQITTFGGHYSAERIAKIKLAAYASKKQIDDNFALVSVMLSPDDAQ